MQIAKWIRERLSGETEDEASDGAEPEAAADGDEPTDDSDDDPSVYPLW